MCEMSLEKEEEERQRLVLSECRIIIEASPKEPPSNLRLSRTHTVLTRSNRAAATGATPITKVLSPVALSN